MAEKIQDIFEVSSNQLTLRDPLDEELKDNPHIIGIVEGQHFVPGGFSRNNRYYPQDEKYGNLWSEVFDKDEDVKERMNHNTMYGSIGHNIELNEDALREGKASHFTKNCKIVKKDNGTYEGLATTCILDTPAGRALKAYLGSGGNWFVSSRADGDYYESATMLTHEGKKARVLDPKKFKFERFDWVLKPGFLQANPKLLEELGDNMGKSITDATRHLTEDDGLSQDVTPDDKDKIGDGNPIVVPPEDVPVAPPAPADDKTDPPTDINELPPVAPPEAPPAVPPTVKGDTGSEDALPDENPEDEEALPTSSEAVIESLQNKLATYESLGTPKEMESLVATMENLINEIGTPQQIRETYDSIQNFFKSVGSPAQIRESMTRILDFTEKFESVVAGKDVNESLKSVGEVLTKAGSLDKLVSLVESFDEFTKKHGDIKTVESMISKTEELTRANRALALSENIGVDSDKIRKMIDEGSTDEKIIEHYKAIKRGINDKIIFKPSTLEDLTSKQSISEKLLHEGNDKPRLQRIVKFPEQKVSESITE